jgi:hypothetical protein
VVDLVESGVMPSFILVDISLRPRSDMVIGGWWFWFWFWWFGKCGSWLCGS